MAIERRKGDDLYFGIKPPSEILSILVDIDITIYVVERQLFKFSMTDKTAQQIKQLTEVSPTLWECWIEGSNSKLMPTGIVKLVYTYTTTQTGLTDSRLNLSGCVETYVLGDNINDSIV